jgi:hypothetical protein
MQDIQNIPNPDVTPNKTDDDFGSHSAIEQDLDNEDIEQVDKTDERETEAGVEQIPDPDKQ